MSSRMAGDVYGLKIVQANIADNHDNITRFFVIGDDPPSPTGEDKTSIVFAAKDRVGVLHDLLAPFAKTRHQTLPRSSRVPRARRHGNTCSSSISEVINKSPE